MEKICVVSCFCQLYSNANSKFNHKEYCEKHGYEYRFINHISNSLFNFDAISYHRYGIIQKVLNENDYVVWISADAMFSDECPSIPKSDKIQLCKDSSGLYNFGFCIFPKNESVLNFLNDINFTLPSKFNNIKDYYNLNLRLSKYPNLVKEISNSWNNTFELNYKSNIIHYSLNLKKYRKEKLGLSNNLFEL